MWLYFHHCPLMIDPPETRPDYARHVLLKKPTNYLRNQSGFKLKISDSNVKFLKGSIYYYIYICKCM